MATEQKFEKIVAFEEIKLEEAQALFTSQDVEDLKIANNKISESIARLESYKDEATNDLIDSDVSLDDVKKWSETQRRRINNFRTEREKCKERMNKLNKEEHEQRMKAEIEDQRRLIQEQTKLKLEQQQTLEKMEEEWLQRKAAFKSDTSKTDNCKQTSETSQKVQPSVKLQKYTITPFSGDYKDWLRFWNQFAVEVDGSTISEISKFNYLLELVKGKPRDDILGLPHTVDGYEEAKRILVQNYGKDSKVHKALIKDLENILPVTNIHKLEQVHDFYNKLSRIVRTLTTMKKLSTAQSTVYTLMDKLGSVREVIVQKDDNWEEWGLEELVEHLRRYIERNPLRTDAISHAVNKEEKPARYGRRDRDKLLFNIKQGKLTCIYCDSIDHTSTKCTRVLDVASRREVLKRKKACFNCATPGHQVSSCRARGCHRCGQKHHTTICTIPQQSSTSAMGSFLEKGMSGTHHAVCAIHPTLHASVNGEKVRIMIDTGASSSYICSDLITLLGLKPARREKRCIEQMYGSMSKTVEVYKIQLQSIVNEETLEIECINAEKDVLTFLPKPCIDQIKKNNPRLRRLVFCEESIQSNLLPVHIMLGVTDFQRIRTGEPPVIGTNPDRDPGAEFTKFGWTLFGVNPCGTVGEDTAKQFFLNNGQEEFQKLCSLDVLGVTDPIDSTQFVHSDFKAQISRYDEGYYEARLPWKTSQTVLPDNKDLSTGRLHSVTRRLEKMGKLKEYDAIMQEQINDGILEAVQQQPTNEAVHYVPHQPVIREGAESTKLRIVFDCSAKSNPAAPSLNDCLQTGPALQPLLFDILLRNRFRRYCVTGDMKKAFLQIRIHEADRDVQRILWYNNLTDRQIEEYRFTRVIFGASPSPYILGATLQKHLENIETHPETVQALLEDTYVDDIQGGGDSKEDVLKFKTEASQILGSAGFELHKWHSNVPDADSHCDNEVGETYAKSIIDGGNNSTAKILGLAWNKTSDEFQVSFDSCLHFTNPITKRKMISAINSVYDVLGWAAPVIITAKIIFGEVCLQKKQWDEKLPSEIEKKWLSWINCLKKMNEISIPRSVTTTRDSTFNLHGFSDASNLAVCASIYVVEYSEEQPVNQSLLVAKSRVAPKNSTIPRLELVAAVMLAKLLHNVIHALHSYNFQSVHCWTDSHTVLYWLVNRGTWSAFVRNRVKTIGELGDFQWKYVPTLDNPSDIGTRGAAPSKLGSFWFKGPQWLNDSEAWPEQPDIMPNEETTKEMIKQTKVMACIENSITDHMLKKYTLTKLLRVTAFLRRFCANAKGAGHKGPLTTAEMQNAEKLWVQKVQADLEEDISLPLQLDNTGIWRVNTRIQGYKPIYIPRGTGLDILLVRHSHEQIGHGGVSSTMGKVRERYWIPKLRTIVKSVVHKCYTCKKYRAKRLAAPPTAALPEFRTTLTEPFAVTGVDFAGPLLYRSEQKTTEKAYIILYTCASTRAVHLKLVKGMGVADFQRSFKEFTARRGLPDKIISDNAKTFKAAKDWLMKLRMDEDLNNYLAMHQIRWQFNLSRAPWWGGFFERLVAIMKSCLSKMIGNAMLMFDELEEVLIDTECIMNNRPLCYLGDDHDFPVITPNLLMRGQPTAVLDQDVDLLDDKSAVTKRMRYIQTCKEHTRKRWLREYIYALEERQRQNNTSGGQIPTKGSVVLITDNSKLKSVWKLGRIQDEVIGKDGVVRGYKIKTGNGYIVERPLQLICDLEIPGTCNKSSMASGMQRDNSYMDSIGTDSNDRRRNGAPRLSKINARNRIQGIYKDEQEHKDDD